MDYNVQVFSRQFPIVRDFVFHYIAYKGFHSVLEQLSDSKDFWVYSSNAHYVQAILNWCMVFGGNGSNPTHWKNLNKNDDEAINKSFRSSLLQYIQMSESEWDEYWKQVVDFRNKFIAHRQIDFNKPVPFLDKAFKVAFFYDEWIRDLIYPDNLDVPPLEDLGIHFEMQSNSALEKIKLIYAG